jgi:hypothetical protein
LVQRHHFIVTHDAFEQVIGIFVASDAPREFGMTFVVERG